MKYPEEIYATRDGGLLTSNAGACWGRRHAYEVGFQAGRAEQADYIKSISSLESVLIDIEQLEREDLPFMKRLIERAFRAGKAEQADPLAGYSNLTAAISAGEPIDWEKLDGLKVQCVNPEVGELRGALERDHEYSATLYGGWCAESMDDAYTTALWSAWHDKDGWTLYIEGNIPTRRKTADQLEPGRCIRTTEGVLGMVYEDGSGNKGFWGADQKVMLAGEVEVQTEYGIGTFQKPEDK